MTLGTRHIWCETLPYAKLRGRHLQAALETRSIVPIVAVTPKTLKELPETLASLKGAGCQFGLWPMIDDASGRWLSLHNADVFFEFCNRVTGICFDRDVVPQRFALDLEPPIDSMKSWLKMRPRLKKRVKTEHEFPTSLSKFVTDIQSMGVSIDAAVLPLVALPDAKAARGWERRLGTPLHTLPFDSIGTMVYTTLFRGYSKGLLSRRDALAILNKLCKSSKERFGTKSSISLGCVGTGALGDEAIYEHPDELAQDIAVVHAAGIRDISLFDLGGVVKRGNIEAWLDAFAYTTHVDTNTSWTIRSETLTRIANMVGRPWGRN